MNYTCYKKTVSKVVDQEITDLEDIKAILAVICNHELTCSMQIKDLHGVLPYKKVRVRSLGDETFRYVTFTSSSTLKREAKFVDILSLEMTTVDQILAVLKPNINRWNLLEADDIDDD